MAAAAVPVEIWSMRAGQVLAANLVGKSKAKVCAVNMSQASALQIVVTEMEKKGWFVDGMQLLDNVTHVERLLTLGIDARLPTIGDNKHCVAYLRALRTWSWNMEAAAEEVSGKLASTAKELCVRIRQFVAAALEGSPAEEWMDEMLKDLLASMSTMKNSSVYLVEQEEDAILDENDDGDMIDMMVEIEAEEEAMKRAAEEVKGAAAADVEIFSLQDGLELAVDVVGRARVRVWGIDVRHAAALEALLSEQAKSKGWDVPDLEQLRSIAQFDRLLSLALCALVPIVDEHKGNHAYLSRRR